MAQQSLQVWTNEIVNDTITFNSLSGPANAENVIELSINLKSGVGRFSGFKSLPSLGATYATPNYINLTVGQPVTLTSNFNFPLGGVVIDCLGGGIIQIVATTVGTI